MRSRLVWGGAGPALLLTAALASAAPGAGNAILAERDEPVVIVTDHDPVAAGERLMDALAPAVGPATPVFLKPNIGGFSSLARGRDDRLRGRITDPAFVEGVVRWLEQRGVPSIAIGDGKSVADPAEMARIFQAAGYRDLAARHPRVRLVDLNHYGGRGPDDADTAPMDLGELPDLPGLRLLAPRIYLDHLARGLVIDIAKLKTHRFTMVSGPLKNLVGAVQLAGTGEPPHRSRHHLHREYARIRSMAGYVGPEEQAAALIEAQRAFGARLAAVYRHLRPHLALVDGILALEGDGFDRSASVPLGLALGSRSPLRADQVAAEIAGWSAPPPPLAAAMESLWGPRSGWGAPQRRGAVPPSLAGLRLRWEGELGEPVAGNAAAREAADAKAWIWTYRGVPTPHKAPTRDPARWRWVLQGGSARSLPPGSAIGWSVAWSGQSAWLWLLLHHPPEELRVGFVLAPPRGPRISLRLEGKRGDFTVAADPSSPPGRAVTLPPDEVDRGASGMVRLVLPFQLPVRPQGGERWTVSVSAGDATPGEPTSGIVFSHQ